MPYTPEQNAIRNALAFLCYVHPDNIVLAAACEVIAREVLDKGKGLEVIAQEKPQVRGVVAGIVQLLKVAGSFSV